MAEQTIIFSPIAQRMIPVSVSELFDVRILSEDSPFENDQVVYDVGIKLFTSSGVDPQLMFKFTVNGEEHEFKFHELLNLFVHEPAAQGDTAPSSSDDEIEVHTSNPGKQGVVAGYLESQGKLIQVMAKEGESKSEALIRVKANHPGSVEVEHSPNPGWHDKDTGEVILVDEDEPVEAVDSVTQEVEFPPWVVPSIDDNLGTFSNTLKQHGMSLLQWYKEYGEKVMAFAPNLPIWKEM